jgi:NitT/TauT family transport system permease protein
MGSMTDARGLPAALARGAVALIVAVALWEFAARSVGVSFMVPDSASVLARMGGVYARSDFWANAGITLWRAAAGYAAAVIVGVPFGLALGGGNALRLLLGSLVAALAATPLIALAPLVTLWFGLGDASKIALAFACAVFPLINEMMTGLTRSRHSDDADDALLAPTRDHGMTRSAVAGLRVAVVPALAAVLVAEMFGSADGFGSLIARFAAALDAGAIVATVLVAAVPAIVAVAVLRSIETRLP